ncbi:MAG: serine/threonine-protein kinase [Elusimicrobiota bacterium]
MIYDIKKLNDIEIIKEIGSGGMGVVYEGFDTLLERKVAVKMMLPGIITAQGKKRFLKEAAVMAKISHPSTINVYSFGEIELNGKKIPYFVMEYIEGKSLADVINRLKIIKKSDPEELKTYGYMEHVKQDFYGNYFLKEFNKIPIYEKEWIENSALLISSIADALYEVHKEGIIHRDIKPSNILLSKNGAKLADFGLVKSTSSNSISTQDNFVGTIKYSAPEVFSKGKHTVESDIYSLGVVFYELLTLSHPFESKPEEPLEYIMNKIIKGEITPPDKINDKIPHNLSSVIMKMLSASVAERFKTMKDVSESIMLSKQSGIEKILTDLTSVFKKEDKPKISESDIELSKEKLKAALNSYILINLSETNSFIMDSVYFNPFNLDAYLLHILINSHGMIVSKKLKEKALELEKYENEFNEEEAEKFKIIKSYFKEDRRWTDYAVNYAKNHGNLIIYLLVSRIRKESAEIYLDKAIKEYPEFENFFNFFKSLYSGKIRKEKSDEISKFKKIKETEAVARIALIEGYLWENNDIEKAESEIEEFEKLYPYHYLTLAYKGYISAFKGDTESLIINLHKMISIISDDSKFYLYYMLYLLYKKTNDTEKAEKYFRIARNLTDEKLKSVEDFKILVSEIDYSMFDFINKDIIKLTYSLFIKDFLNYLFEESLMTIFKVNSKLITLEGDEECYLTYISSKPSGRIDFIPLGNFYDIKGNILKAKYRQIDENSYNVEVEENKEQKDIPVIFIGTQKRFLKIEGKNYEIDYEEKILAPRISKRVFAVSKVYEIKKIETELKYQQIETESYNIIIFEIDTLKNFKPYDMKLKIKTERK